MRFVQTVVTCILGVSLTACGQGNQSRSSTSKGESAPQAKTKLEAFQAKTGVVVVKGFSTVGAISGEYGGKVSIDATEITDAADGTKQYGITIEVTKGGQITEQNTSYIDYDEIDSLLKGIAYISKINSSVTKLGEFQADYRTRGDLDIATFSDSKGKVMAAVESGSVGRVSTYLSLSGLDQFKDLIVQAKSKLDSVK